MQTANTLIKSFLGGLAICVGGIIYLSLENHYLGAFLFSIGLFTIYTFDFSLFTGKICYIFNNKPKYLLSILLVYIGNLIGTVSIGYLLRATKLSKLVPIAEEMAEKKLSDTPFSAFIMAILCGLMMCIAVMGFSKISDYAGKIFVLAIPIIVFILAGFEHSIADFFYFSLANAWGAKAVIYSLIYAAGNIVGASIIPLAIKFSSKYSDH